MRQRFFVFLLLSLLVSAFRGQAQSPAYDVVVYGATPGGIAAALSGAREGASVLLVEELNQVGGLTTGGLSHPDFRTLESLHGIYREYMQRSETHYRRTYGPDSPQLKQSFYGTHAEPHVARKIFEDWLKEYPKLTLHTRHRLQTVQVLRAPGKAPKVTGATFVPLAGGKPLAVRGAVFIDGTYEGDLMAKAGCAYRIGRESRQTYGELFAGKLYYHDGKFMLGSTGEGDRAIQAYNFRVCMTDSAENRLPIPRPASYDRTVYQPLLEAIRAGKIKRFVDEVVKFQYIPNRKADVNDKHFAGSMSLSRPGWSHDWPEASPEKRQQIYQRHLDYTLGLFYFLQHDAEVPEAIRQEALAWGLPKDEYVDNNHFTPSLYVREGRRLVGTFTFLEQHCQQAPGTVRGYRQPDAVAVGDYGLNSHGCDAPPAYHPGIRDGAYSMYYSNLPYQVPYGVMVPKLVDGLLVPVAVSSSHVGYSALRYEPTWMALGQAAGLAAVQAIRQKQEVRQVAVPQLQASLHRQGATTAYFSDLTAQSPYFRAFQWAATNGLYHQVPAWGSVPYVDHFVSIMGQYTQPFPHHAAGADQPMDEALARLWLRQAGVSSEPLLKEATSLSRGAFLQRLYEEANRLSQKDPKKNWPPVRETRP